MVGCAWQLVLQGQQEAAPQLIRRPEVGQLLTREQGATEGSQSG